MLKVKTMTNKQSAIFSKMLDTNWTVKELMEVGKYNEARIVSKEHNDLVNELKKSMGESKYNEFIDNGRKMFS
jgi:hypothetical protein